MSNPTLLGIAAGAMLATSGSADIINVPGDQPTIQAGITAAINGDEVIVAQGEYFENINFFGKAITVRSTDPNDAGVVLNTIINGGGLGTVVICNSGEGSDTVLSGFVITGGNAFGGGMFNNNSSPTVTNCSFSGNTASWGGGMVNVSGSSPTVTNCSFSGNTAIFGGGMFTDSLNSIPTVTNCTFSGNSATSGGGMFNVNPPGPTVTNCTFSGNTASDLGGGMANCISSPTVTNCSFSGNSATNGGGGMITFGPLFPTLSNTGFCDNTPNQIVGGFTDGGGNSLLHCPPPIDPCPTDTNGDGVTNVLDLIDVLLAFGDVCP